MILTTKLYRAWASLLQALLWAPVVITDNALWVFGLSPAPTGAGSRRVYCKYFGHRYQVFFEQYHI